MKRVILMSTLLIAGPLQAAAAAGAGAQAKSQTIDPKRIDAAKQALKKLQLFVPQYEQARKNLLQTMAATLSTSPKTKTYARLLSNLSQAEAALIAEDNRNPEIFSSTIFTNADCFQAFERLIPYEADCAPLVGLYATHTRILDSYAQLQKELSDCKKAHIELADKLEQTSQTILRLTKERNALRDQLAGGKAQHSAPQNQPAPQVEGSPAAK